VAVAVLGNLLRTIERWRTDLNGRFRVVWRGVATLVMRYRGRVREVDGRPAGETGDAAAGPLGGRLAHARGDARRIADELVRRGLLSAEEATALESAVASAVERASEMVTEAVREARRVLGDLRGPAPARLDDLATRVARLERALADADAAPARAPDGRERP